MMTCQSVSPDIPVGWSFERAKNCDILAIATVLRLLINDTSGDAWINDTRSMNVPHPCPGWFLYDEIYREYSRRAVAPRDLGELLFNSIREVDRAKRLAIDALEAEIFRKFSEKCAGDCNIKFGDYAIKPRMVPDIETGIEHQFIGEQRTSIIKMKIVPVIEWRLLIYCGRARIANDRDEPNLRHWDELEESIRRFNPEHVVNDD